MREEGCEGAARTRATLHPTHNNDSPRRQQVHHGRQHHQRGRPAFQAGFGLWKCVFLGVGRVSAKIRLEMPPARRWEKKRQLPSLSLTSARKSAWMAFMRSTGTVMALAHCLCVGRERVGGWEVECVSDDGWSAELPARLLAPRMRSRGVLRCPPHADRKKQGRRPPPSLQPQPHLVHDGRLGPVGRPGGRGRAGHGEGGARERAGRGERGDDGGGRKGGGGGAVHATRARERGVCVCTCGGLLAMCVCLPG